MLKRIAVVLTAATVLGVAPASAQVVYGGGWWAALTATTATIRGAIFTGDTFTSGAAGGPATDYVS